MRLTPAIVEMFHKHCDETVVHKYNSQHLCGSVITNIGQFGNI